MVSFVDQCLPHRTLDLLRCDLATGYNPAVIVRNIIPAGFYHDTDRASVRRILEALELVGNHTVEGCGVNLYPFRPISYDPLL